MGAVRHVACRELRARPDGLVHGCYCGADGRGLFDGNRVTGWGPDGLHFRSVFLSPRWLDMTPVIFTSVGTVTVIA